MIFLIDDCIVINVLDKVENLEVVFLLMIIVRFLWLMVCELLMVFFSGLVIRCFNMMVEKFVMSSVIKMIIEMLVMIW